MSAASAARDDAPVFTRGSTMRHVAVMTATLTMALRRPYSMTTC